MMQCGSATLEESSDVLITDNFIFLDLLVLKTM